MPSMSALYICLGHAWNTLFFSTLLLYVIIASFMSCSAVLREEECECVCVRERECVCACVCVCEREEECVCVFEREHPMESEEVATFEIFSGAACQNIRSSSE